MKRGWIFKDWGIRAILEGRKTMTRRIQGLKMVNKNPDEWDFLYVDDVIAHCRDRKGDFCWPKCPYQVGDVLWLRETWYCDHWQVQKGPYLKPEDLTDKQLHEEYMYYRATMICAAVSSVASSAGSVHGQFTADMCKRTVINRTCKPIINSSDDEHLKLAASRSEVIRTDNETEQEIEENADQDVMDVEIDDSKEADKPAEVPIEEERKPAEEATEETAAQIMVECPGIKGTPIGTVKDIEWCRNNCKGFKKCRVAQDAIAEALKTTGSPGGQMSMGPDF